jgi:hypothetical protein
LPSINASIIAPLGSIAKTDTTTVSRCTSIPQSAREDGTLVRIHKGRSEMRKLSTVVLALLSGCIGDAAGPPGGIGSEIEAASGHSPSAQACDPSQFMTTSQGLMCCQDGKRVTYVAIPPGTTTPALFFRRLGAACTLEDGSTHCGFGTGIPCYYGPCGGATHTGALAESLSVFVPESRPDECGWEASGITGCLRGCDWGPEKELRYYPEPYDAQTQYPGFVGTCPARACFQGRPCLQADCSDQR